MNDFVRRFVAKQAIRRLVIPLAAAVAGIGVSNWYSAIGGFIIFFLGLSLVAGTYEKAGMRESDRKVAELFNLVSQTRSGDHDAEFESAGVRTLEPWPAPWPVIPDFGETVLLYCSLCGKRFERKWLAHLASKGNALRCPHCRKKLKWKDIWVTRYKEL